MGWGGEEEYGRGRSPGAPLALLWHSATTWWGGEALYFVGIEALVPYSAFSGTTPRECMGESDESGSLGFYLAFSGIGGAEFFL